MEEGHNEYRYNSFDEYISNYGTFKNIQGEIGEHYESFPNVIVKETKHKEFIIGDCLRLRLYLLKFATKEACEKKNCCAYINYLLNYYIRNYYESQKSIFKNYTSYMNDDSNHDIKELCGSKINDIDDNKYQKIFKLYTGYKICENFIYNKYDSRKCSLANSCSFAYNNIITTHPELNDVKFCKALKNFKDVLESYKLKSKIKCSGEYLNLLSYPESCTLLLQKSEQLVVSSGYQAGQTETQIESEGPSGLQEDQMVEIQEDYTTSPSSLSTTLPISLFSSGMGGLLILLSFYKFTPLGQWLKLHTQRYGAITKNSDEELYEMQQPTSEYDERNSEYIGYNIAYNSL
ncbi:PIR Superfamily Protein [Plasmodium ovale curtisi]|uniref:PIR Superfamily Protein n=1 Tax=Plasmodium ovale curtisi TaxID=864141 RepID=A0A1A8XBU3_PLAOA|nr:PIR Superfamily Protein [Plasmodium ovale curtisi]